uniref:Uncharacterized protein n=1 Tax=Aegilops tauschii subsp. strangulata TaxID=200361 RepID=A0A453M3J4_AEGTS
QFLIYNRMILQENPDLWKWLTGQEQAPETVNSNPVCHTTSNSSSAPLIFSLLLY